MSELVAPSATVLSNWASADEVPETNHAVLASHALIAVPVGLTDVLHLLTPPESKFSERHK